MRYNNNNRLIIHLKEKRHLPNRPKIPLLSIRPEWINVSLRDRLPSEPSALREQTQDEGGRIIFHGLFPSASISGEGLVPQIGVELSKWPLTTCWRRRNEGAWKERGSVEGTWGRGRGCSDSWFGFGRRRGSSGCGYCSRARFDFVSEWIRTPWSTNLLLHTTPRECTTTTNLGLSLRNSREKEEGERRRGGAWRGGEREVGIKPNLEAGPRPITRLPTTVYREMH